MADDARRRDPAFLLWLEDAVPGWILPVAAIVVALGVFLLSALGVLAEETTAALVVVAFGAGLSYALVLPAVRTSGRGVRALTIAAAVAVLGLVSYAFVVAVHPGAPVASATLSADRRTLALPAPGTYRLVVSGRLQAAGEVRGEYVLRAGGRELRGAIDRAYVRRTARRASVNVSQEHTANAHEVTVASPPEVLFERTGPELRGEIAVSAHRALPPWALFTAIAAAVLLSAAVDALTWAKGRCALAGIAAGAFTLILRTVTPDRVAAPTFWAALLAAAIGALLGTAAARAVRPMLPAPSADERPARRDRAPRR